MLVPDTQDKRVLVADSRRLVRELLTGALGRVPRLQVTAGSSDFGDVLAQAFAGDVEILLLGGSGYPKGLSDAVFRAHAACPQCAILVVVDSEDDDVLLEAAEAGATGFVTLGGSLPQLVYRVQTSRAGEMVLPPKVAAKVLSRVRTRPGQPARVSQHRLLTSREREVLMLLTDGLGNAEIAHRVGVSSNTVKNHLYSIYRKLGVNSRSQAFAEAARMGLVGR